MSEPVTFPPKTPKRIGIATSPGGQELKEYLAGMLRNTGHQVMDYADDPATSHNASPEYVLPLAQALACGELDRGVVVFGCGGDTSAAVSNVPGVRARAVADTLSARLEVEDDDLNVLCLNGLAVGRALAWELVRAFLAARFGGAERNAQRPLNLGIPIVPMNRLVAMKAVTPWRWVVNAPDPAGWALDGVNTP